MHRSLYLAAYDVRNPRRLRKVLRVLKDYASGGQKSAFECYLFPRERRELVKRVGETMDCEEDAFLLISLNGLNKVKTLGVAVAPVDEFYTYVG